MNDSVIIIGAGVSGLYAASQLIAKGVPCKVLEARDRIGGRVLSEEVVNRPELGKFDLGPTWFWPEHEPLIAGLVKELNLKTFEQYTKGDILFERSENSPIEQHNLPQSADPKSARLTGGIASLVNAIAATLLKDTVELSTRVTDISLNGEGKTTVQVELASGEKKSLQAKAVILALPTRIIAEQINFVPALSDNLAKSLADKSTWMGGQAKVVAVYDKPFWREAGLSGQAISRGSILQEIHDASPEDGAGALFGFFAITPKDRQEIGEKRILELVVDQLTRFYGTEAAKPISLLYKDWSIDKETAAHGDLELLTDFPLYGLPTDLEDWQHKIIFAGTETSTESGGHLEGALQSAERAVSEVLSILKAN